MTDTDTPDTDTPDAVATFENEGGLVRTPEQEPADPVARAGEFVREHPVLVIAGGLAIGALAAALLPRGNRSKVIRRAVTLAEAASAAGVLLGKQAREHAGAAGQGLRERGGEAARGLERLGEAAGERLHGVIESAGAAGSKAGKRITDTAGQVRKRLRKT